MNAFSLPVGYRLFVVSLDGLGGGRATSARCVLSPSQQQWLAQQGELRVGLVLQAPYAQYDRRLQRLSGVNVELMKWLAKTLNVELSWRNFPDLEQLEAAARAGEIDHRPGPDPNPGGTAPLAVFRSIHAGAAIGGQRPEKHRRRGGAGKTRQPDPRRRAHAECDRRLSARQLSPSEPAGRAHRTSGTAIVVESAGFVRGGG
jgi:hypothetical protein